MTPSPPSDSWASESAPELVTIASGDVRADIAPSAGGRLAQLTIDGTPLLISHSPGAEPTGWGSYPMVPWAGRIRRGRFSFDGTDHQMPTNFGPHSIHGVGFTSDWHLDTSDDRRVSLSLDMPTDHRWPFGGVATQELTVGDDGITLAMTVTATDRPFPVSFGWHPWFRKPTTLDFRPTAMYRRDDDHVAVDELVEVPPGPCDDCFVNTEPIGLLIDGVELRLTSNCGVWVVYGELHHATCIEPPDRATGRFQHRCSARRARRRHERMVPNRGRTVTSEPHHHHRRLTTMR